jgi:ribosomal-protein-alanine N-acetyltransferase
MTGTVVLETERLRLTSWSARQWPELVALHGDPGVARYLTPSGLPWSEEACKARLALWMADFASQRMGKLRLIRKSDGALVGRAGFGLHGPAQEPELGFALFPDEQGKGYAREASRGLVDWLFAETEHRLCHGFVHRDNIASIAVLKHLGMQQVGEGPFEGMPFLYLQLTREAHRP